MHWFFLSDARIFVLFERDGSYYCVGWIAIVGYLGHEVSAYVYSRHDMIDVTYVHSRYDMILEFQIQIY